MEELVKRGLEFSVDLLGFVAVFGKEIAIVAGAEGALVVGDSGLRSLGEERGGEREGAEGEARGRGQHGVSGYVGRCPRANWLWKPLEWKG